MTKKRSIKLKNNHYWDSSAIMHEENLLFNILNTKTLYDTGNNRYGSWIRFTDGTMITYRITQVINVSINTPWGNLFYGKTNDNYDFPIEFKEIPFVIYNILPSGTTGVFLGHYEAPIITTTQVGNLSVMRPNARDNAEVKLYILAIGKWK